jgi:hypothetical protein
MKSHTYDMAKPLRPRAGRGPTELSRLRSSLIRLLLAATLASASLSAASPSPASIDSIMVTDIFGRTLNQRGLVLVDWDGYIANPAIKIFIKPPGSAVFPASATITSLGSRLYFNLPSTVSSNGPAKTIVFGSASDQAPVLISIFPDRDMENESYPMTISLTDAHSKQTSTTIPIHVIDQDRNSPPLFKVTVDFSHDQTGFFVDPHKRRIVEQAADDWAYFFDDMKLDPVLAGAESTSIWKPDGFKSSTRTLNRSAYRGFLLYAYGIHSGALRSGGEGSHSGGFQSSGGIALSLRRSGGYEAETEGNYNGLGWLLTASDDDWLWTGNLRSETNDLYSIAHHEIGHALSFNSAYPRVPEFKDRGRISDPALLAYHGSEPAIDGSDHLQGELDRASQKGAFGYEYFGEMPRRRWIITKLDLLCAQAIGYRLRRTSAFAPLSMTSSNLPPGNVSAAYQGTLHVSGGIPSYFWEIVGGALPRGLSMDSFTGVLSGTPREAGTFNFSVRIRGQDWAAPPLSQALTIVVVGEFK